jgi:hypothetical protein
MDQGRSGKRSRWEDLAQGIYWKDFYKKTYREKSAAKTLAWVGPAHKTRASRQGDSRPALAPKFPACWIALARAAAIATWSLSVALRSVW